MARKRKQEESIFQIALSSHWGVAAFLCVASLFVFFVLIPSVTFSNPILKGVGIALSPLGYIFGVVFAIIAIVNFFKGNKKNEVTGKVLNAEYRFSRNAPTAGSNISTDKNLFYEAWKVVNVSPVQDAQKDKPEQWSLSLLRKIEWRRFEALVAAYFMEKNYRCEIQSHGPDGGIDVRLYQVGSSEMSAIVQCKAWTSKPVGAKELREFLGVMTHQRVSTGYYLTTGNFNEGADLIAKNNRILTIPGQRFIDMILGLPIEAQKRLLMVVTEGDYTVPTCVSCGTKMTLRKGARGEFWGCPSYPKCRATLPVSKSANH